MLLWGPEGESTHTFAGGELYSTNGFGQNRDAQRGSVMGQYEGKLGDRGSYRLLAQGYSTEYHTAGIIRADDYQSGRIGFYDSYDLSSFAHQAVPEGGNSSRYSIAGDIESHSGNTTLTQQVFAIKRDMRLLENFTGYLLDVQMPLQQLHLQRGDEIDMNVDESTVGARGAARLHEQIFGQRQEIEFGYFAREDWVHGTQKRLEASTGAPYLTDTDLTSQLGDIGLYADANLRPVSWINLRGGVRGDLFTFNVHDNCAVQSVAHPSPTNPPIDQSCLSQQDYGLYREPDQRSTTSSMALLPRASLIVGPFYNVSLSLSYGQGIRSIDPSYITQDIKTPFASVKAYEGGLSYCGDNPATLRSSPDRSGFRRTWTRISSSARPRVVTSIGVGTTRTGWVNALRLSGAFFDEAANLTLVKSSYDDTGLLVAYVPDAVLRSDTAVFADLPFQYCRTDDEGRHQLGRHLRRSARTPVRSAKPEHLHGGCVGDAVLVAHRSWDHRDEPAEQPVPPRRVQLRLRLSQPAPANARARAAIHRRCAEGHLRHVRRHLRRWGMKRPGLVLALVVDAVPLRRHDRWGRDRLSRGGCRSGGRQSERPLRVHQRPRLAHRAHDRDAACGRRLPRPEHAGFWRAEHGLRSAGHVRGPDHQRARRELALADATAISRSLVTARRSAPWLVRCGSRFGDVNQIAPATPVLHLAGTADKAGDTRPFVGTVSISSNRTAATTTQLAVQARSASSGSSRRYPPP